MGKYVEIRKLFPRKFDNLVGNEIVIFQIKKYIGLYERVRNVTISGKYTYFPALLVGVC